MEQAVRIVSAHPLSRPQPRARRARRGVPVAAKDRMYAIAGRAGRYASLHACEIAGLATLVAVALVSLSGVAEAASWSWSDPLPRASDFAAVHDQLLHAREGPGLDMGHIALWQLSRRYLMPLWLAWSMLMSPHP